MLKRVKTGGIEPVKIRDAVFPALFPSGLEYGAPARGTWNIVHTGMLIPEAHEIFVCAASCLRGVVLTAAEMNAEDRFSTVEITEKNLLEGTMEDLIYEGVSDIIPRLKKTPPVILLYTSCIHHFTGCDMESVFERLGSDFPQIRFVHCFMNPIMRKSGMTPEELMRKQLYSLLEPRELNEKSISLIGNDLPTDKTSELLEITQKNGYLLRDITAAKTYEDYQKMAESQICIVCYPQAKKAGEELERRLGSKMLYLPISFNFDEIKKSIDVLNDMLGAEKFCHEVRKKECEERLFELRSLMGDTPIAIDYTAVPRPFELARLLCDYGFSVRRIYADAVTLEDAEAFLALKETAPDIEILPTVHAAMRVLERSYPEKIVAIGQKAAYFTGTKNFVNIVEGGGHWGYDGVLRLLGEIEDAFLNEKETEKLIQVKGWGCGCS